VSDQPPEPVPDVGDEGDLGEFDFADPLKRNPEEGDALPGADPIVTIPPEE
jgi:hypothetical protein